LGRVSGCSGPTGKEEEGGPIYLFSYLKCLRPILELAKSNDLGVLYARHVPWRLRVLTQDRVAQLDTTYRRGGSIDSRVAVSSR